MRSGNLYFVIFASLIGLAFNSFFVDTLHWRHFWLLLALAWVPMLVEGMSRNISRMESSLKIVQIITRMDTVGGAQIHVRDISVGLENSGHDVYLIAGGTKNIHTYHRRK